MSMFSFVSDSKYKRYHVKSGIVKYKYEGKSTGTKILYFDNWGMIESQLDKMTVEVYGMTQKTNNLIIIDDKDISLINLTTKIGYKNINQELLTLLEFNNKDLISASEKMMLEAGGKKLENVNFLGKNCNVWLINGIKKYTWKGIPMRIEMNLMGMDIVMSASEIVTDVVVDKSKFEVPSGIKFIEEPEDGFNF